MSTGWTIRACSAARYEVISGQLGGHRLGVIKAEGGGWRVHFDDHPELDFKWGNTGSPARFTGTAPERQALDVCVGYVRGIERMRSVL